MISPVVDWEPSEPSDGDNALEAYRGIDWAQHAPSGVVVETFDGWCPVQGRGTIDGLRWYFRARGEHFQFHVAKADDHLFHNDLFYVDIEWPAGAFGASWMEPEDAIKCLHLVVNLYRQENT